MKDSGPKNIEDLYDMFSNPNRIVEMNNYMSQTNTKIIHQNIENEIHTIFKEMNFTKISRSDRKTFDYIEKEHKILAEITTIQSQLTIDTNTFDSKTKISKAIDHIGEKDSTEYPDHLKGGIIQYDSTLAILIPDLITKINDEEWIIEEIKRNNLDYVIFKPFESMSGLSMPRILYVKKEIISKFSCIENSYQIIKI